MRGNPVTTNFDPFDGPFNPTLARHYVDYFLDFVVPSVIVESTRATLVYDTTLFRLRDAWKDQMTEHLNKYSADFGLKRPPTVDVFFKTINGVRPRSLFRMVQEAFEDVEIVFAMNVEWDGEFLEFHGTWFYVEHDFSTSVLLRPPQTSLREPRIFRAVAQAVLTQSLTLSSRGSPGNGSEVLLNLDQLEPSRVQELDSDQALRTVPRYWSHTEAVSDRDPQEPALRTEGSSSLSALPATVLRGLGPTDARPSSSNTCTATDWHSYLVADVETVTLLVRLRDNG